MRRGMIFCLALLGYLIAGPAFSEEADGVIGQWLTDDGGARIEIFKENGTYCGKIVWLKEPVYPKEDKEAGKPIRDRNNPDPAKRDQPYVGIYLLRDFAYKGENTWTNGTIYNPENGKTYSAKLRLESKDKLKVRGFIGISLIGGSTFWSRCEEPATPPAAEAKPKPAGKDAAAAK